MRNLSIKRYCFIYQHTLKVLVLLISVAIWITYQSVPLSLAALLAMPFAVIGDKKSHFYKPMVKPVKRITTFISPDYIPYVYAIMIIPIEILFVLIHNNISNSYMHLKYICIMLVVLYWLIFFVYYISQKKFIQLQSYIRYRGGKIHKEKNVKVTLAIVCLIYITYTIKTLIPTNIDFYEYIFVFMITFGASVIISDLLSAVLSDNYKSR
ncbi:MAG: hypothetical protein CL942_06760 [Desulfovibrio sp.]|nr:hypothetical protein [Desulfovibrio sp.]|tara:strand:- start:193 stop:822 length:630 start_codon:yes stop_codon:yes gene_type:complete